MFQYSSLIKSFWLGYFVYLRASDQADKIRAALIKGYLITKIDQDRSWQNNSGRNSNEAEILMERRPQWIFNKENIVGRLMVSPPQKNNIKYDMISVHILVKMS